VLNLAESGAHSRLEVASDVTISALRFAVSGTVPGIIPKEAAFRIAMRLWIEAACRLWVD
jgi:hypothetical protein